METARLPYTRRNVVYAAVFWLLAAGYTGYLHGFNAGVAANSPHGWEGEAAFIVQVPLLLLTCFTGIVALATTGMAVQRGSQPVSGWLLFLTLLPPALVLLVVLPRYFHL